MSEQGLECSPLTVNVGTILAQELQRVRVVVLHGLRHVNDVHVPSVVPARKPHTELHQLHQILRGRNKACLKLENQEKKILTSFFSVCLVCEGQGGFFSVNPFPLYTSCIIKLF